MDRLTRAKELCQHFYLSQGFMEAPEWEHVGKDFQNGFLALADQSLTQESVRSEALRKAADTFRDLSGVLQLLGRPVSARACEIAEEGCRSALQSPARVAEGEKEKS